jgi:branched-subunit amino acid transport protein
VSEVWLAVIVVGVVSIAIKAVGPVLLHDRRLPRRLEDVVALLAPAVLAALVVTQAFASDRDLVVDERAAGLAAAGAVVAVRGHMLVAALAAAVVTGSLRAI